MFDLPKQHHKPIIVHCSLSPMFCFISKLVGLGFRSITLLSIMAVVGVQHCISIKSIRCYDLEGWFRAAFVIPLHCAMLPIPFSLITTSVNCLR